MLGVELLWPPVVEGQQGDATEAAQQARVTSVAAGEGEGGECQATRQTDPLTTGGTDPLSVVQEVGMSDVIEQGYPRAGGLRGEEMRTPDDVSAMVRLTALG